MVIEEADLYVDVNVDYADDEKVSLGGQGARGRQFDWRDSSFFVASGGRLMENVLFRGIIDSLRTLNVEIKPNDGTAKRRYARWEARDRVRRAIDAREWVRTMLPQYWSSVFRYSPEPVVEWCEAKWKEIDEHPNRAMSARRMVSDCLVEDYHND